MSAPLRAATLVALAAAVPLAFHVLDQHYDALDRERAIPMARARQYGPTTRARVDSWLASVRPGVETAWRAEVESSWRGAVEVTLTLREADGPRTYRWRVDLPARAVEPADDDTRRLVATVAQWAHDTP